MPIDKNANFHSQTINLVHAFIDSGSFDRQLTSKVMGENEKEKLAHDTLQDLVETADFKPNGKGNTVQDFFNALVTDEAQNKLRDLSYDHPANAMNRFLIAQLCEISQ